MPDKMVREILEWVSWKERKLYDGSNSGEYITKELRTKIIPIAIERVCKRLEKLKENNIDAIDNAYSVGIDACIAEIRREK